MAGQLETAQKRHLESANLEKPPEKKQKFLATRSPEGKNARSAFLKIQLPEHLDGKCVLHRPSIELQLIDELEKGGTAKVYSVVSLQDVTKSSKVLKIIEQIRGIKTIQEQVEHEFKLGKLAHEVQLGPAVFDSWTCETNTDLSKIVGLLLMENVAEIVKPKDWFSENLNLFEMIQDIVKRLRKFHAAGYTHNDITYQNILVTRQSKAFLIDYGSATPLPVKRQTGPRPNAQFAKQYAASGNHVQVAAMMKLLLQVGLVKEDEVLMEDEFHDLFNLCARLDLSGVFQKLPKVL